MSVNTASVAICFGMVFSNENRPNQGQEYRDTLRCKELERILKCEVRTVDIDHNETYLEDSRLDPTSRRAVLLSRPKHTYGNFNDSRRLFKLFRNKYPNMMIRNMYWDYFFSPASYLANNWSDKIFSNLLPAFINANYLDVGATLWFPNYGFLTKMVERFRNDLEKQFTIAYIPSASASQNELYQATHNVETGLLLSADKKINSNQITELNFDYPFIRLTYNLSALVDLTADSDEYSDIDSSETKVFDQVRPASDFDLGTSSCGVKRGRDDGDNDSTMPPLITDSDSGNDSTMPPLITDSDSDNQSDTDSPTGQPHPIAEKGSFPFCEVTNGCNHYVSKKKL